MRTDARAAERLRAYAGATSKGRRDERAEAERVFFVDGDRARPRDGASAVYHSDRTGRWRCRTFQAFCALQAGKVPTEGAELEPLVPERRRPAYEPYRGDPAFWQAVRDRAHREAPVRLEDDEERGCRDRRV